MAQKLNPELDFDENGNIIWATSYPKIVRKAKYICRRNGFHELQDECAAYVLEQRHIEDLKKPPYRPSIWKLVFNYLRTETGRKTDESFETRLAMRKAQDIYDMKDSIRVEPEDPFRMEWVDRVLALVSDKNKDLFKKVYLDGLYQNEVAEELGVTESRVSQIMSLELRRLRKIVKKD